MLKTWPAFLAFESTPSLFCKFKSKAMHFQFESINCLAVGASSVILNTLHQTDEMFICKINFRANLIRLLAHR